MSRLQDKKMKQSFSNALKYSISSSASAVKNFVDDNAGNISTMFGLSVVPMTAALALATDMARFNDGKIQITDCLDAAGLAISRKAQAEGYSEDDVLNSDSSEAQTLKKYGRAFFEMSCPVHEKLKDYDLDFNITKTSITPVISGRMETMMLGIIGIDNLSLTKSTEVTLPGTGKLEVALVLDVTGSMSRSSGSGTRMSVLKGAVDDMFDEFFGENQTAVDENVKVGIVPFNTTVNIRHGADFDMDMMDTNAESHYHGANFFHAYKENGEYLVDPDWKVNHFAMYDSMPNTSWTGCTEVRPYPFDEMDVPIDVQPSASDVAKYDKRPTIPAVYTDEDYDENPTIAAFRTTAFSEAPDPVLSPGQLAKEENTKFVPLFAPDQSDCWNRACNYTRNGSSFPGYIFDNVNAYGRGIYGGFINENSYYNRWVVDDYTYTRMGSPATTRQLDYFNIVCQMRQNLVPNMSGWCPSPNGQLQEWQTINDRFGLPTSGNSIRNAEARLRNHYPGMWDGTKYANKYDITYSASRVLGDCNTQELLPLTSSKTELLNKMNELYPTGGTNTAIGAMWGWRVLSPEAPFTEGVNLNNETDWTKAMVFMTDGENNLPATIANSHFGSSFDIYGYLNEDRMGVGFSESDREENLDYKTVRICERMKEDGIRIYTVGFNESFSDSHRVVQMLKACASVEEGDSKTYFLAKNANELKDAFSTITEDLTSLHISR